jgi:hypothetical protein
MRAQLLTAVIAVGSSTLTWAESAPEAPPTAVEWRRFQDFPHRPAFEVNVLWPFFPGGIVDLKLLLPVLRADRQLLRGELIAGLHSDFAIRVVRDDVNHGKVGQLGVKVGWRQFFAYGLHAEASVDLSWREERQNTHDGTTLEAFTGRLWLLAGWQVDLTERVYLNARGGAGIHLFRVGDIWAHTERLVAAGGDLNLGIRF